MCIRRASLQIKNELAWYGNILQNSKSDFAAMLANPNKKCLETIRQRQSLLASNNTPHPTNPCTELQETCTIENYSADMSENYSAHVRYRAMISNAFCVCFTCHANNYSIYFETTPPILTPV